MTDELTPRVAEVFGSMEVFMSKLYDEFFPDDEGLYVDINNKGRNLKHITMRNIGLYSSYTPKEFMLLDSYIFGYYTVDPIGIAKSWCVLSRVGDITGVLGDIIIGDKILMMHSISSCAYITIAKTIDRSKESSGILHNNSTGINTGIDIGDTYASTMSVIKDYRIDVKVSILSHISSILSSLHSFDVICCNLNHISVIIDSEDNMPYFYDFTRAVLYDSKNTLMKPKGDSCNEYPYYAPETMTKLGRTVYNKSVDVYSLGWLMLYIITSTDPVVMCDSLEEWLFDNRNKEHMPVIMSKFLVETKIISQEEAIFYSESGILKLICRCISHEPSDRPTALECHKALFGTINGIEEIEIVEAPDYVKSIPIDGYGILELETDLKDFYMESNQYYSTHFRTLYQIDTFVACKAIIMNKKIFMGHNVYKLDPPDFITWRIRYSVFFIAVYGSLVIGEEGEFDDLIVELVEILKNISGVNKYI